MNKKYTEDDVKELVAAAIDADNMTRRDLKLYCNSATHDRLSDALKPFLPDPEAELLEAMAKTNWGALSLAVSWENLNQGEKDTLVDRMRSVLAVVKEKGLPQ